MFVCSPALIRPFSSKSHLRGEMSTCASQLPPVAIKSASICTSPKASFFHLCSLQEFLSSVHLSGGMTKEVFFSIAHQMAEGLTAVHKKGYVHGWDDRLGRDWFVACLLPT